MVEVPSQERGGDGVAAPTAVVPPWGSLMAEVPVWRCR